MKCKFYKKCKMYSTDSYTCNEDEGRWGTSKMAGCWNVMQDKEEKNGS